LFVQDGSAAIGASLDLKLLDPHGNGRLVLLGFGSDTGVTSDLGNLTDFVGLGSIALVGTAVLPGGPTNVAASVGSGGSLAAGSYFYLVTARVGGGETPASAEVKATVPAAGSGKVTLTWNAVSGATGYKVYRGTASGGENVVFTVSGGGTTTFADDGGAG